MLIAAILKSREDDLGISTNAPILLRKAQALILLSNIIHYWNDAVSCARILLRPQSSAEAFHLPPSTVQRPSQHASWRMWPTEVASTRLTTSSRISAPGQELHLVAAGHPDNLQSVADKPVLARSSVLLRQRIAKARPLSSGSALQFGFPSIVSLLLHSSTRILHSKLLWQGQMFFPNRGHPSLPNACSQRLTHHHSKAGSTTANDAHWLEIDLESLTPPVLVSQLLFHDA
jgi:hypothetical protein